MRLGGFPMVLINHPDHFQHVLVENHANYNKDNFLYRASRTVLREGLIGNIGGEPWKLQRRLMQPAFRRASVAAFTRNMTDLTADLMREWEPARDSGTPVDVTGDIADLALKIVLRSLFGVDADDRSRKFEREFLEVNAILGNFFRFPFPPLTWRTPSRNRLRTLIREMDGFIHHLIKLRDNPDREDQDRPDLFALLLHSVDEETGDSLSGEQLANEILAMIIAGYETSSNSISWVFYQLAQRPEVQDRVQAEVDEVLGGRAPGFDDIARLTYTRMVIDETLRLYSPAWQTMRSAVEDDVIGGYRIPGGTNVYLNFFAFHRNPDIWPEADTFDPERFRPGQNSIPPAVYQPFGSGPRHCIGKHFALTELVVITAMFAQAYRVSRPAGQPPVGFAPLTTLHPKGGISLLLNSR